MLRISLLLLFVLITLRTLWIANSYQYSTLYGVACTNTTNEAMNCAHLLLWSYKNLSSHLTDRWNSMPKGIPMSYESVSAGICIILPGITQPHAASTRNKRLHSNSQIHFEFKFGAPAMLKIHAKHENHCAVDTFVIQLHQNRGQSPGRIKINDA